ncbi:MAG TPA: universal stress protein [Cytophagaceae bacterium]
MLRILVPTDFTDSSKNAVNYAAALTHVIEAELYLLNVTHVKGTPHVTITEDFEQVVSEQAEIQLENLKEELSRTKPGIKVEVFMAEGYPVHQFVHRVAEKNGIDLIVMSGSESSGTRAFLGSTTTNVLENMPCPVLVVPKDARFEGFNNILYATDLKKEADELPLVIDFARLFNAKLHILHIIEKQKVTINDVEKGKLLREKYRYSDLKFTILKAEDKAREIERYARENKEDLILIFIHNRSYFENLFQYSVTKELSFESSVPLLVFKKPGE